MSYFNDDGYDLRSKGKKTGSVGSNSKSVKKAVKKAVKVVNKKQHRKGKQTFSTYIFKTLRDDVGKNLGMSKKGMAVMNSVVTDVFERLMKEARNLATYTKKATVGSKEIVAATKFILPGQLSKHAVAEGQKAVAKFESASGGGRGKKSVSRSSKAGLIFPVGRIARHMRKARVASRIGAGAPVFVAAVLQYITAEVLDKAKGTLKSGAKRITPRYVNLGIMDDEELKHVFSEVTIAAGGVEPNKIHDALLSKKAQKAQKAAADGGIYYY